MAMTLTKLAKIIGVSSSTISRVVNNKGYVSPKTRRKIQKALIEYNYTPNQVARSLKSRTTNTIAVIVPDISENFFAYVIKGIKTVLNENDYTMILCDTDENEAKEEQYINMLLQKQVDGIILATVSKHYKSLNQFLKSGKPVIFFDNLPDINISYDAVLIDNVKASSLAVEHLIKLGHRKIGIIVGKQNETTGFERLNGYKKSISENGMEIEDRLICIGDFKENSGFECMQRLLENKDMTAVYITSSKMTYGAIKAITQKGLKIPGDIALVGFDIHDPSGLISPGITTIMQNEEHIGLMAAELLFRKLKSEGTPVSRKVLLEPSLIIRQSCGYKST
jgi:LacI family transcriptional regulator